MPGWTLLANESNCHLKPNQLEIFEQLVGRYEARIAVLEAQVRDLTEQVRRLTPRNSSIPPSSEHPHAKPVRKKTQAAKQSQVGQSGHKRLVRELIPSE